MSTCFIRTYTVQETGHVKVEVTVEVKRLSPNSATINNRESER